MALSDFYESTIIEVKAYFGFSEFTCKPEEITETLSIQPVETFRKGDLHKLRNGKVVPRPRSSWSIESQSPSKDINVHLRELLKRLYHVDPPFADQFGRPDFSILWKGNYLYAGSGPFYEADVLQGIAAFRADLWQDIYQIDQETNEPVGPARLRRL